MYKCGLEHMLYYELNQSAATVIEGRIGGRERKEGVEYFVAYSAGGFINLLCLWIKDGMRKAPEKYAKEVARSLGRFIRTAGTGEGASQQEEK